MPQRSISDGSGKEPGLIGQFIGQYEKKQTSRAYRTDLQKFEAFLKGNLKKRRGSATLKDASRRDVLRFLFEESQSVGRSTVRRRGAD
jgi:site-specific recombinase XerD